MSRFDVGDRVWHKDEKLECFVVEVSFDSYSLRQSKAQEKRWGKINWVAWLKDSDLEDAE